MIRSSILIQIPEFSCPLYHVQIMKELVKDAAIDLVNLLTRFSFDLNGLTAQQLVNSWLSRHPAHWVQLALVEALYQGRYKARSIEQILMLWHRRGYPLYHFNHEFERIIRGRFSRHLPMQSLAWAKLPIASVPSTHSAKSKLTVDQASTDQVLTDQVLANQVSADQLLCDSFPNDSLLRDPFPGDPFPSDSLPSGSPPVDLLPDDRLNHLDSDRLDSKLPPESAPLSDSDRAKLVEELRQVSLLNAASLKESCLHLLSSAESIAFLELQNSEPDASPAVARELPIQAFKPMAVFQSETITKMKELALAASRLPVEQIQQFVPTAKSSDFYSKLKAVATERSKSDSANPPAEAARS
jgi:hypothetical protein